MSKGKKNKKSDKKLLITAIALVVAIIVVAGVIFVAPDLLNRSPEIATEYESASVEKNTTEEATQPANDGETIYKDVIEKYKSIVAEYAAGAEPMLYSDDPEYSFGPYYLSENTLVEYAFADLNNDTVPEMIVAIDGANIINIWKYSDGLPKCLFGDAIVGNRSALEICEDGYFKKYYTMSGGNDTFTFYKYDETSPVPYVVGSVGAYGNWQGAANVTYAKYEGEPEYFVAPEENIITQEEYESILSQYKIMTDFEWHEFR